MGSIIDQLRNQKLVKILAEEDLSCVAGLHRACRRRMQWNPELLEGAFVHESLGPRMYMPSVTCALYGRAASICGMCP
jgi:hypothetical protein